MRGQVERLNRERAVAAIRTGPDDYTVVEFHDGAAVFPSDWISGTLDKYGCRVLRDLTSRRSVEAVVVEVHAARREAMDFLS